MKRIALALICGLVSGATLPAAARPMTPEDVARLRMAGSVEIAPDGSHIAYGLIVPRIPFDDEDGPSWSELHVVDIAGVDRPYVTGAVNVSALAWTSDGSALTFTAKRGDDEHSSLYRIPLAGGEAQRLFGHGESLGSYALSPDGSVLAFTSREPRSQDEKDLRKAGFDAEVYEEQLRPARLWLASRQDDGSYGEARALEVEGHMTHVRWCPAGGALLVNLAPTPLVDDSYTSQRLHIIDPESGMVRARVETPGKLADAEWSPDCRHVALIAAADAHDTAPGRLMVADAASGEFRDLWPGFEGHVRDLTWAGNDRLWVLADESVETLLYSTGLDGSRELRLPAGDLVWDQLSLAGDGTLAMVGQGATFPREVFRLAADAARPERLTDSNPWLAEIDFAPQETLRWNARDGLALEGVLVRPLGLADGERAPLILSVHGGPEAHDRDGWVTGYSAPGQVAAARGFAVLYPNYRGSTGRGVDFARLSQARPAAAEFDDLVDAIDALVAAGLVDGNRVGITGGSYGGYATAWASTRLSERFAAGVMFVGISNKISKLGTSDIAEEMYLVHERKRLWEDWQHFLEASPIYYVEQARTPLLILGGTADTRVDPGQSLELYRHLKTLRQTPVRLVRYPGEPHGNQRAASRYDYNLRMLRWFEHYLQGEGGEAPDPALDYPLKGVADSGDEAGDDGGE